MSVSIIFNILSSPLSVSNPSQPPSAQTQISSQHISNPRLGLIKFQPYLVVLGLVVNVYILQATWVRALGLSTLLAMMTAQIVCELNHEPSWLRL